MAFGLSAGAMAAIGTVGGALISADAADNAADAQMGAATQTNNTNRAVTERQIQLQEPFRQAGLAGNNRLMELLGLDVGYDQNEYENIYNKLRTDASNNHALTYGTTWDSAPAWAKAEIAQYEQKLRDQALRQAKEQYKPGERSSEFGSLMEDFTGEDLESDPGYKFRREQGMRGVEGSAAARGGLLSGAAMKAIQKYGQGLASDEFNNAWQRDTSNKTNKYNRLAGIVNTGQGATNQVSNSLGNFATNNASAMGAYGNAQAAGYMGQANALNNGIGQATNYYQQNQLMDLIRNPGVNRQYFTGNQGMGS